MNFILADIRLDLIDIDFENNYFDVIICCHVLEHIKYDQKAIHELFRVLKQKGITILQVPISKTEKETFEDFSITNTEERKKILGRKIMSEYRQRL